MKIIVRSMSSIYQGKHVRSADVIWNFRVVVSYVVLGKMIVLVFLQEPV